MAGSSQPPLRPLRASWWARPSGAAGRRRRPRQRSWGGGGGGARPDQPPCSRRAGGPPTDRKRRDLEAGIVQAFREVHGREVASGERRRSCTRASSSTTRSWRRPNPAPRRWRRPASAADGDCVWRRSTRRSPASYLWLGIDMDSDAASATLFGASTSISVSRSRRACACSSADSRPRRRQGGHVAAAVGVVGRRRVGEVGVAARRSLAPL